MSFWGRNFSYGTFNSENYNIFISSPNGGDISTNGSSDVSLYTQEIFRRPTPYFYGVTQNKVLEFDVSFRTPYELDAQDYEAIAAKLFGQQTYQKLQIDQYDIQDIYFNCFFKSPKMDKVGNIVRGITATVVCDSPWAWKFPQTTAYTFPIPITSIDNRTFINLSDNAFFTLPKVTFTMDRFGGDARFQSIQNTGTISVFTGLSPYETITMDNDLQIITSSTGLKRLSNFNKQWFKLVRGENLIRFSLGNMATWSMETKFAKKFGG